MSAPRVMGSAPTRPPAGLADLAVQPPRRRVRVPELTIGVVVMVGFALAAVLWHMSAVREEPALALAADVARGEVIEHADLKVVHLSSDDAIAHLTVAEASSVIGGVAVADLPAGTLIVRGQVAASTQMAAGEGVVGLALEVGQVPAPGLVPGDVVNVVTGGTTAGVGPAGSGVVASGAEVFAVQELEAEDRRVVSLKLPEGAANDVAAAAERGPVRLVRVAR